MDPSQNFNFHQQYHYTSQSQNPNIQPSNSNAPGFQPNFGSQYPMPPNFSMQYPYNHPYMPYAFPPIQGNTYVPTPINYPDTDPYTPHSNSGSHDIPDFSTQVTLGNDVGDNPSSFTTPTQQSNKRIGYEFWSAEENKSLLTGYFHVSNDSELGTNQKADTFWGKVADFVNDNREGGKPRTMVQCKSHFRNINKKIGSFIGYYSAACRKQHSGWCDEDYITKAVEEYTNMEGSRFTLLEEWKVVRRQPRYMTGQTESASSGSKRKSGSDSVDSSVPSFVRPEGRNATKKKARASSSRTTTSRKSTATLEDALLNLSSARQTYGQAMAEFT